MLYFYLLNLAPLCFIQVCSKPLFKDPGVEGKNKKKKRNTEESNTFSKHIQQF